VGKVMKAVPGFKPKGSGRFFYPRHGFGRISDAFADAARERGAEIRFGHSVTGLERRDGGGWTVSTTCDGAVDSLDVDHVWSTIPVTLVARMLKPAAPESVIAATKGIDYRAMVLIYLDLPIAQFTEYDAHYFPGADLSITRLSEPSNYGLVRHPEGRTALCAELPCARGDRFWNMSDEDLGQLMADDLARAGLPLPCKPVAVHAARLPQAYPIYLTGYETHLDAVQNHVDALPDFLSFGRQGLFAHDNTHHALHMSFCAVDCLGADGRFDAAKWAGYRQEFAKHVVED
jgi:protoporphyrinogen oxidase